MPKVMVHATESVVNGRAVQTPPISLYGAKEGLQPFPIVRFRLKFVGAPVTEILSSVSVEKLVRLTVGTEPLNVVLLVTFVIIMFMPVAMLGEYTVSIASAFGK